MKKTIIFASIIGGFLVGIVDACADTVKKVATVGHVVANGEIVETAVSNLQSAVDEASGIENTNESNIDSLSANRQAKPANECSNLDTTTYSGCGYISGSGGANGREAFQWVKIVK